MLHVYRQITGLREFRPVVLCQKRENADRFPFDDVVIEPKPWTHQLRRLWQKTVMRRPITIYRSEAQRILATLRRRDARLLQIYFGHIGVHLLPLLELIAAEKNAVKSERLPIIVSFHGADADVDYDQPAHRVATQRVFQLADTLLVRSVALQQRLIEHGAPARKIALNRTGIPLDQIAFKERSSPPDGAWKLLQASRLIPKKGITTTLRAFADFAKHWPKASLTIAGEGSQLSELAELASNLGLAERVTFTGFLSQLDLRRLEHESHIFVHPSERGPNGDQEGVPNAMLEAMASGLPVAATLHGGIPEAVDHGESGYLVPEGDADGLASALLQIAGNPDILAGMSRAAAANVASEFEAKAQIRRLEEIYRATISRDI